MHPHDDMLCRYKSAVRNHDVHLISRPVRVAACPGERMAADEADEGMNCVSGGLADARPTQRPHLLPVVDSTQRIIATFFPTRTLCAPENIIATTTWPHPLTPKSRLLAREWQRPSLILAVALTATQRPHRLLQPPQRSASLKRKERKPTASPLPRIRVTRKNPGARQPHGP